MCERAEGWVQIGGIMCKGPQTLACVALSQMGKTKQNTKPSSRYGTIQIQTADKDVLVGVDEQTAVQRSLIC